METFADRFKRLRAASKLTQLDIANKTGVTPGAVQQVENGTVKEPGAFWFLKAARLLDTDPWTLAFGEGAKFTSWQPRDIAEADARIRKLEDGLLTVTMLAKAGLGGVNLTEEQKDRALSGFDKIVEALSTQE